MEDFEKIYSQYFDIVFRYVLSLCKDETLAEEITQETFFKAVKSINSFKGDCDTRVWLCQIAKNTFFTHKKYSSRFAGEEVPQELPDRSVSIEDRLEDNQQTMAIHRILHEMGEPYKEVFSLRVFGELSFRQIGDIFGKTESWARVTFHRAKLKIIDELEEQK